MRPLSIRGKRVFVAVSLVLSTSYVNAQQLPERWQQTVQQHPSVQAAEEQAEALIQQGQQLNQPLYNPTLSSRLDREGDINNYAVGLSQTIDWSTGNEARASQSDAMTALAMSVYRQSASEHAKTLLNAYVQWFDAKRRYDLAQQQEQFVQQAIKLVSERRKAGDLSAIDEQLTLLALSRQLQQTASAYQQLQSTQAKLNALLPGAPANELSLSEDMFQFTPDLTARWQQHPAIKAAYLKWQLKRANIDWKRSLTTANPTVGVEAGESDNENVVGLTFSIPLQLRNNYSNAVQAASREALAEEKRVIALKRQWEASLESSLNNYRFVKNQWQSWQQNFQARQAESMQLIEQSWLAGDLSTTDYLTAMQQQLDSQFAGIGLQTQYRLAAIEWLYRSGKLSETLELQPLSNQ
ncbi:MULTISPECIES: TolC family protein [Idiomarina]|jgi:outer membrane protein TolC|uniref:TolC family protein n=1 Tax=Idiomarina TaxID=135575 RepID=UPI000C416737|nr:MULTISPECIES: TolC family protein [Idiomarina]MAO68397.1 ABC transporter permease [Idiomarina sp.]MBF80759.1 ABC transporter permease [Idiomarina sp.]|tara:strand:+ start:5624 stop:6853 length:1230 start_codon:yes stop_codon:yes gene_type:complete